MASFAERVERSRQSLGDSLRLVNQAAAKRPTTPAEATERRIIAEEQFRVLGLHDFLTGALAFIKQDGHCNVKLNFDWHTPESDPATERKKVLQGLREGDRLLATLQPIDPLIKSGSAIAEFRYDYKFIRIQYSPVYRVVKIMGDRPKVLRAPPRQGLDSVEAAIVEAYGKPGIVPPDVSTPALDN